jgi:hypothetical protein
MGRNTTTPNPSSLDRFSVGEIQDLSGVSDFYNAGTSSWLKSGVLTSASNLSTTTKTILAAAGTSQDPTVIAQSALSNSYNAFGGFATNPIERISASQISVVPSYYNGSTSVGVGVMTSAGLQFLATGQTSLRTSNASTGTNGVVASNNTTIFSYCFSSSTALSAFSTTNGTTWTSQTVSGLPTFAATSTTIAYGSDIGNTAALTSGWRRNRNPANPQFAVFWCGARFVLIGPGATDYMVSLSTDGLAWGGDNTTAVIGATAQARSTDMQFYRNGNNCFLNIGTSFRFSTDGGVTWADSTFSSSASVTPSVYVLSVNQSDPAKLVIIGNLDTTTAYYSSDSGQNWSTSRTLPVANQNGGFYYKGSTVVISTNVAGAYRVSTNDGVTWTTPIFPIGVLDQRIVFMADANRFYACVRGAPQLLTSSDGVTWTIVTLSQNNNIGTTDTGKGFGRVVFDSNTVMLIGYNNASGDQQCHITTNGGVTWTSGKYMASFLSGVHTGHSFSTPDGNGVSFIWSETALTSPPTTNVLKPDLVNGGAFYKTGSTAITPVRTGSFSYVRVG